MTPLCLHKEEFVCEKCLQCSGCCRCKSPGALVHRNSRSAAEAYAAFIRKGKLQLEVEQSRA